MVGLDGCGTTYPLAFHNILRVCPCCSMPVNSHQSSYSVSSVEVWGSGRGMEEWPWVPSALGSEVLPSLASLSKCPQVWGSCPAIFIDPPEGGGDARVEVSAPWGQPRGQRALSSGPRLHAMRVCVSCICTHAHTALFLLIHVSVYMFCVSTHVFACGYVLGRL